MFRIFKYLKDYKATVLLIVALLVAQAMCDLALPQYTADIVDVGLTQSGITSAAPTEMRPETYAMLAVFMTDEERQTVEAAYGENAAGNLARQGNEGEALLALETALGEPAAALARFSQIFMALPAAIQAAAADGAIPPETLPAMTLGELVRSGALDAGMDPDALALLREGGLLESPFGFVPVSRMQMTGAESQQPQQSQQSQQAQQSQQSQQSRQSQQSQPSQQPQQPRQPNTEGFSQLLKAGLLPPETLLSFRQFVLARMGETRNTMVKAIAIQMVKMEYTALGMDLGKIQTNYLLLSGAKMLGMTLAMVAAAVLVGLLASRTAASIGMNLRGALFRKVVSFSPGDVEKFSTASLITRSTNDIQHVQMVAVMTLRMVIYAPILGIGGVVKVANTRTGLSWIILVAVAFLLVLVTIVITMAMPKFRLAQTQLDHINLVSREILTGLPVIRAFNREERENKRFDGANTALMRTQRFVNRLMSAMMPIMMLVTNGLMITIVWFGAKGIDMGNLQVGSMMAFITYTMQIVMSFLMLAMISAFLPRAAVSAARIEEVLGAGESIRDHTTVRDDEKDHWDGTVAFEGVGFRYPDAEENILTDISFTAKAGKTTAIIGSTGSGKSTLLNLIPRFFDVTEGRITLSGVDIRDLSQKKLRGLLGYVPQKGVLFSGDIASNIKYAGGDITDEMMREAAEIAQASDFIGQRPRQYSDPIAQGGANVSGGQKQRLSIARAIAKKPKVLLFDDSFSALDYQTDVALRRALNARVKDATVIIVAQRINTVLHADQIVVLEDGRMAGAGTHGELMRSCGAYQEIAKSQLSEAELKGGLGA